MLFWCQQAASYLLLALYLQEGRGLSPIKAGGVFAVLAAGYLATSFRAPALTMRFGRRVIAAGALVAALGDVALRARRPAGRRRAPVAALFPGLFLLGAGQGLCITPLTTTVLSHADASRAGSVSGALSTAQQVGNAIGVAVSGVIFYGLLGDGHGYARGLPVEHRPRWPCCWPGWRRSPSSSRARRAGPARGAGAGQRRSGGKVNTSPMATTLLTIGEFSRMTHLSVKALRHYHDVGVLEPAAIDPHSGYRSYDAGQVTSAQVIRRLRDLGMPLDSIRAVLTAPDLAARNREITAHLERMERQLEQTQAAVSGLRALLGGPAPRPEIEFRTIPAVTALAVAEVVTAADVMAWGTRSSASCQRRSAPAGWCRPGRSARCSPASSSSSSGARSRCSRRSQRRSAGQAPAASAGRPGHG